MDDSDKTNAVTDADIQAIIDDNEAGVADLMAAYEPLERRYFAAVQHAAPSVTYSIDTNPR